MNAEIKEMPAYRVASVRKLGPYGPETAEAAFKELAAWAGPKGLFESEQLFGLYWDNPEITPPEQCRMDACITFPGDMEPPLDVQTISAGSYAVCHFEITADQFPQAWMDAFAWLEENGHEYSGSPCYEFYHSSSKDEIEVVDICIPVMIDT